MTFLREREHLSREVAAYRGVGRQHSPGREVKLQPGYFQDPHTSLEKGSALSRGVGGLGFWHSPPMGQPGADRVGHLSISTGQAGDPQLCNSEAKEEEEERRRKRS